MHGSPRRLAVAIGCGLLLVTVAARAEHPAIRRAEAAIAAKNVVPERDIQPLVAALGASRNTDERRELVGAIADLGESEGQSPNAVKDYLREHAPPVLLEVAKNGANPFLQGDALSALRGMRVPRAVLEEAASIAEASPDEFVKSRGEIMRGWIASLPPEDEAAAMRPADPEKKRAALAFLDQRGVGVSTQALRDAARDALPDYVKALLDAGVAPDTGVTDAAETPLYFATFSACHSQGAETDWLVETVRHLVGAGANLALKDDNGNTVLMNAVRECGPRIVALLIDAGADFKYRNGSGVSPLVMALISEKPDAAEVMVAKGARLSKTDLEMVRGSVTDAKGKALIKRASGG